MQPANFHRRIGAFLTVILLLFCVYTARLIKLQLVDGKQYASRIRQQDTVCLATPAARGEILDCRGILLATNRTAFSLVLDGVLFPRSRQNEILVSLINLLREAGEEWNDTFPLTGSGSGAAAACRRLSLPKTASPAERLEAAVRRYALTDYPTELQSLLAGVRYTMEVSGFNAAVPYVFATEVSRKTASVVSEQTTRFSGVSVRMVPVRDYPAGTTAAHLIGVTGRIGATEYEQRRQEGYQVTDRVEKSGLEAALESLLRGIPGQQTVNRESGESVTTVTARAGDSVVLTVDSQLQAAVQTILDEKITDLRSQQPTANNPYVGQDVRSGSAVLLNVRDGGVLVCASCPGYDLSRYACDYAVLAADESLPLFNRALFGTFPCGSVIKPAVAVSGLINGVITPDVSPITCTGRYRYYADVGYCPKCMGRHGDVTLTKALGRSCNVYFFEVGRLLGITRLNRTLTAFGLGQKTGIEIGESAGILASPQNKAGQWVAGDTCQCAIGQMEERFTPIQLAVYAMTLANKGVRYRTHLVSEIRRRERTVSVYEPEILSTLSYGEDIAAAVQCGMEAAVHRGGTAYAAFRGAPYTLAAKTGTAENSSNRSDHGVFIAYAPLDKPEVALAVVMENGTSAGATSVARQILDAYFEKKSAAA